MRFPIDRLALMDRGAIVRGAFVLATYTLLGCAETTPKPAMQSGPVGKKTAGLSEFEPQGEPAVGKFADTCKTEIVEEFIWGKNRKDHRFHIYEKQWSLNNGIGTPVRDWFDVGAVNDHKWKGSPDVTKLTIETLAGPASPSNATGKTLAVTHTLYPIPIRRSIVVAERPPDKSQSSIIRKIIYDDSHDNTPDRSNPYVKWDTDSQ
jgi:hypothetical protein